MYDLLRQFERWLDFHAGFDARRLLYVASGWTMGQRLREGTFRAVAWPSVRQLTVRELLGRHTMLARSGEVPPRALSFEEALAVYVRVLYETLAERLQAEVKAWRGLARSDLSAPRAPVTQLLDALGFVPVAPSAANDFWLRLVRYLLREQMEMTLLQAVQRQPGPSGLYGLRYARAGTLQQQVQARHAPIARSRATAASEAAGKRLRRHWFRYAQARRSQDAVDADIVGLELSDGERILGYATARVVQAAPMTAAAYVRAMHALDADAAHTAHAAIQALGGDTPAGTALYLLDWELQPQLRGEGAGFALLRDLFNLARQRWRRIDHVAAFLQPVQYLFPLPEKAPPGLCDEALEATEKLHLAWLQRQPQRYAGEGARALLLHPHSVFGGLRGSLELLAHYFAPSASRTTSAAREVVQPR